MTKKHYEAIARILYMNYPSKDSNNYKNELVDYIAVASNLADYFATDNPKFDRARFLQACGVENTSGERCPDCGSLINDYYQNCSSPTCDYMK